MQRREDPTPPAHSMAAISTRDFPRGGLLRRLARLPLTSLATPNGVTWAVGTAVAGWIPAALVFSALGATRWSDFSGGAAAAAWLFCVACGLVVGSVAGRTR